MLTDGSPLLTGVEVQDKPRVRVVDGRAVEHSQHETEKRNALFRIEAPVDGIDQDQRVIGAEGAVARLLRKHGKLLAPLGQRSQLLEDRGLGGAVELHRRIAPRAYAEGRATLLRAGQRQHHAAHACADARENVEPVGAAQGPPRTHGRAPELVGICLSAFGRAAWVRSSPCAGGGVCARRRW